MIAREDTVTSTAGRKGRWTLFNIFTIIVGFAIWWPLGIAIIGYLLWGGSMEGLVEDAVNKVREHLKTAFNGAAKPAPSGNSAFDDYKADTLKRLQEEQAEFAAYVQKLRDARDAEEFRRFMDERRKG
jgi:hypothetical protein